jgi:uracil-DNA glycosylase
VALWAGGPADLDPGRWRTAAPRRANDRRGALRAACAPWLAAELEISAADLRVIVCLGGFAWQALWPQLIAGGWQVPRPRPAFGHGAEVAVPWAEGRPGSLLVLGCYHPSQQNTFTGRVNAAMLDEVFGRARSAAGL